MVPCVPRGLRAPRKGAVHTPKVTISPAADCDDVAQVLAVSGPGFYLLIKMSGGELSVASERARRSVGCARHDQGRHGPRPSRPMVSEQG